MKQCFIQWLEYKQTTFYLLGPVLTNWAQSVKHAWLGCLHKHIMGKSQQELGDKGKYELLQISYCSQRLLTVSWEYPTSANWLFNWPGPTLPLGILAYQAGHVQCVSTGKINPYWFREFTQMFSASELLCSIPLAWDLTSCVKSQCNCVSIIHNNDNMFIKSLMGK